jgi:hypothetical protein
MEFVDKKLQLILVERQRSAKRLLVSATVGWLPSQLVWLDAKFCWVNASHHCVSFSRPIAAAGGGRAGGRAGMFWACETEPLAKLIHRGRQAGWGLHIMAAENLDEFGYQELP